MYTLFSERTPIFLGYSLSDPNISFLYDEAFAHFGRNKSPAFMVVHPSTSDAQLREANLFFGPRQIYLIRAEVGEFLESCKAEMEAAQGTIETLFHELGTLKLRLETLVKDISSRRFSGWAALDRFKSHESASLINKSIYLFFQKPELYQQMGGAVLSPPSKISYYDAHHLIQVMIALYNKYGWPNEREQNKIFEVIFHHCTEGPYIWDFNVAAMPFTDILSIRPNPASPLFLKRLKHVKKVLDWSAPAFTFGYCWGTWDVFVTCMKWLRPIDIEQLVNLAVSDPDPFGSIPECTRRWLKKLLEHPDIPGSAKDTIEVLVKETRSA